MTRRRFAQGALGTNLALQWSPALAKQAGSPKQSYFPRSDQDGGWRTLTDGASLRRLAGIDRNGLDRAFTYTQTTGRYGGLLVVRHGYLVYERYFGRAGRDVTPNMASCGKMFTSVCLGIAMQEKPAALPDGLHQKVFTKHYLPEAFPLNDERKADIELGHLLTMTAGLTDGGGNPGIVAGEDRPIAKAAPSSKGQGQDERALGTAMWTTPGAGYCYSTQGVHVASIVLRHIVAMEMENFIKHKIATPLGWGGWGYDHAGPDGTTLPHTPGGAAIALRATDALRFGYLLLQNGFWNGQSVIPSAYIHLAGQPSPFNPHSPFSLQFEVNADEHVAGVPKDAFFKSGAGGFCLYVVPSLDLVVYKIACVPQATANHYDLNFAPHTGTIDASRDDWKPHPFDQFHDGPVDGDAGTRRTLQLVCAAVDATA